MIPLCSIGQLSSINQASASEGNTYLAQLYLFFTCYALNFICIRNLNEVIHEMEFPKMIRIISIRIDLQQTPPFPSKHLGVCHVVW